MYGGCDGGCLGGGGGVTVGAPHASRDPQNTTTSQITSSDPPQGDDHCRYYRGRGIKCGRTHGTFCHFHVFFPSLGLVQMNENKIAPIFILVTFVRYTCVFSWNTRTV